MIRCVFLFLLLVTLRAAEDGSSVIVVYNSKMPESKSVADHYAERRKVPAEQVIGLPLSDKEAISRSDFHETLELPLLKKIESLKLLTFKDTQLTNSSGEPYKAQIVDQAKIRYAALCYGVPLKVTQDNSIKDPKPDPRPETRRNEAAVDAELALLPSYYAKLDKNGPLGNRFYGATNVTWLSPTNGLLLVTRLDGPSPEIAKGLVDKAIFAEKNGWWGRAYFDLRSITNADYKLGDDMLKGAERHATRFGFESTVDPMPAVFSAGTPMPQIGLYAGWYELNVTGALAQPEVEFLPGAFAYHLHSFSAQTLRSTTERWAGPLLAKGATCTLGATEEPYLQGTPDIAVFVGHFLFGSASFGEAAYVCQQFLSWQTTAIGDPLYRPFVRKPQQIHEELEKNKAKDLDWSLLRVININLSTQLPVDEALKFLRSRPETRSSALLSEKVGDLSKGRGQWLDAIEPYERALALNPTPQQRLKITLSLTTILSNLGRGRQAYELYQGLLRDFPNYPDRVKLLQKILPLADQFGTKEDAAGYQKALQELSPK